MKQYRFFIPVTNALILATIATLNAGNGPSQQKQTLYSTLTQQEDHPIIPESVDLMDELLEQPLDITTIDLFDKNITDSVLDKLTHYSGELPLFKSINFGGMQRITARAFIRFIERFSNQINNLNIPHASFHFDWAAEIAQPNRFVNLQRLNLAHCNTLTSISLARLIECLEPTVLEINFSHTQLDRNGIAALIIPGYFSKLRKLDITGCLSLTDEDIAILQHTFPHCEITR